MIQNSKTDIIGSYEQQQTSNTKDNGISYLGTKALSLAIHKGLSICH